MPEWFCFIHNRFLSPQHVCTLASTPQPPALPEPSPPRFYLDLLLKEVDLMLLLNQLLLLLSNLAEGKSRQWERGH